MERTYFTLFSGGDGAGIGLSAAGYQHLGGVEYDAAIAAVAAENEHPLTVADVCDVDPLLLPHSAPTWLHASPVCKNASQAKTDGEESDLDIQTAEAACRFIRAWLPPIVSIENVWGYREFDAFKRICACLTTCGYSFEYWHLNSADYGVPQTRKRLILIAKRGLYFIQRPEPTHREGGDLFTPPWVGWYEAIEDLIPMLPESKFAPWQLARLPEQINGTTMLWNMDQTMRDVTQRTADQPVPTIDTGMFRRPSSIPQAFIVHANDMRTMPVRDSDEPMFTVMAGGNNSHHPGTSPKAFILDCQNGGDAAKERGITMRYADEPCYTITTGGTKRPARAWLVSNNGEDGDLRRRDDEPAHVITTQSGGRTRAWLSQGRVVAMTPRALACFQSFPRWYKLPQKNTLACTVIGNACPPLLFQRLAEST